MRFKIFIFLISIIGTSGVLAQPHSNEIGFETDNDSYLAQGSDRYYTAGNFIYFRHALKVSNSTSLQNKVLGFEVGQKLFTPQSGSINFTVLMTPGISTGHLPVIYMWVPR